MHFQKQSLCSIAVYVLSSLFSVFQAGSSLWVDPRKVNGCASGKLNIQSI